MKAFNIFYFIWRIWLWITVLLGLVLFSPIGIILISFEKTYYLFHIFCRYWCRIVLFLNGFWYDLNQHSKLDNQAYIICPNHTSKFDIILLFATFPSTFVFMGKQGLTNITFFEWFYNKTMITFKRGSVSSAYKAYRKADRFLKRGVSIVIFPEGGVPPQVCRLQKFKSGAFKLAIANQVSIVPMTFIDNKRKYPEDSINIILGSLRVVIHKLIPTKGLDVHDINKIKDVTFEVINKTLMKYENR